MSQSRICPICYSHAARTIRMLASTFYKPMSRPEYALCECDWCGTIYLDPPPTVEDFRILYEESDQFTSDHYQSSERVAAVLDYLGSCYRRMVGMVGRSEKVRVLEIGAGLSWMARAAKADRADAVTTAQDVSPEAATLCPWVDEFIVAPTEDKRLDARGPYDVISITHVIEHVPDPVATLTRSRELLAPDGCVFVTAPHQPPGWIAKRDPEAWVPWSYNHTPAHLTYFSRGGLEHAGRRAGLRLESWSLHEDGSAFEAIMRPALVSP